MGTTLTSSPNFLSSSNLSTSKVLIAGLAMAALTLATGAPADAKTSVQGGQNACKAAFQAQTPAPSSLRVDANATKAWNDTLVYAYKVKTAGADKPVTVTCTVDRNTNAATLMAETAPPTTLATR